MIYEERLEQIRLIVEQNKFCSIQMLTAKVNTSHATIRRDLKVLEEQKKLKITRGGAMAIDSGKVEEPPFTVTKTLHQEQKARIAAAAVNNIKEGETVLIDAGSTTTAMGEALRNKKHISVATNDLLLSCQLVANSDLNLTVIGGDVRKRHYTTAGMFAKNTIKHLNADKVFLGIDAINLEKGCMVINMAEAEIKRAMLTAAKEKIIICDHTKFESVAFLNLCRVDNIDKIITGKEIDIKILASFLEAGVDVETV